MKTVLSLLVVGLVLTTLAAPAGTACVNCFVSAASTLILFQDDFDDGNADGWTVLSGSWNVVNGEYICQLSGRDVRGTSEAGEDAWADYTVEVDIKIVDGIDAGVDVRRSEDSHYSVNLRRSGTPSSPDLRLWKYDEGQSTLLVDIPLDLRANTWYSVRISLVGANIQVFIDDSQVINYTDSSSPITHGKIGLVGWTGSWDTSIVHFDNVLVTRSICTVPYFSQRDPRWINHPLRTNGVCSEECNTIGKCGCTLTSAAMVFEYYGANLTPATLSDCMGIRACPFYWGTGAVCSEDRAQWVGRHAFSWGRLEHELNQNKHPIILGMHKGINTHWVVVLSGNGSDPANYTIHDPWPIYGANMKLDVYSSRGWNFDWLSVYAGQPACKSIAAATTGQVALHPQPVIAATNPEVVAQGIALTVAEAQDITASSVITGSAWLYRMTAVTMTVQLTATTEAGDVTEMLVWTDSMTQTIWQPFSSFVYLPISDQIYARFRDASDNVSEMASDTLHPVTSPPTAPFETFLPLILRQ
jgi:hypothetical protein